jgi:hypothetical protein
MRQDVIEQPIVTEVNGLAEMSLAIDEVITSATRRIVIFDRDLLEGGYNTAQRFNRLKVFLLGNRNNRLDIALHKNDHLERDCVRMMNLLRQFPYAISIHRTLPEAQRVSDGFVVADGLHYFHRFHLDHPRGKRALHDEAGGTLLQRRFEEIWTYSEPAAASTVLGL